MYTNPGMKTVYLFFNILAATRLSTCQKTRFNFIVLQEKEDVDLSDFIVNTTSWNAKIVIMDISDDGRSFLEVDESHDTGSLAVIDTRSGEGTRQRHIAKLAGIVYLRAEHAIVPLVRAALQFTSDVLKSDDAALIFQNIEDLENGLYYLIAKMSVRFITLHGLNSSNAAMLRNMRPTPSVYIMFADTPTMSRMVKVATESDLMKLNNRWQLVFTDFNYEEFNFTGLRTRTNIFTVEKTPWCKHASGEYVCPVENQMTKAFINHIFHSVYKTIGSTVFNANSVYNKEGFNGAIMPNGSVSLHFYKKYKTERLKYSLLDYNEMNLVVSPYVKVRISSCVSRAQEKIGKWSNRGGLQLDGQVRPLKLYLRIGTGYSVPLAFPTTGKRRTKRSDAGLWKGYCIELIKRLSEDMDFDYELVTSYDFGRRLSNGSWTGLVGLLATGKIDMIVGALTVTSKREEVIDFITPYILHTGITIVIRKPSHKTSLFKFMTVLRGEVWLSILCAISVTAVTIWFLDKHSPYSYQNNRKINYVHCRKFTLKESFWFTLTSFTPQGGGDVPRCLSARTLVGAYWIFVVLVLATFTANLAAFLTAERMESPVKSLEQLSKQSRIKYTVVKDSIAHNFFRNMKNVEEILYKVWKETALNSSNDKFVVWDYPIKEQFGSVLTAIEKTKVVSNSEEGIWKVMENEDAEFALIHDALEINYNVRNNCNLTTIGDVFAKRPYAIAVQQGSQLTEALSRSILDLQKERFFESLNSKYLNLAGSKCNSLQDNGGITLQSLGGVFIASLSGLALSMIFLGAEVFYSKKMEKRNESAKPTIKPKVYPELITGKELGTAFLKQSSLLILAQHKNLLPEPLGCAVLY